MSSQPDAIHVRYNRSALAIPEKLALVWMARRLPSWVNSDHLTLLGLSSMALAGASYWLASRYPQALLLVVVALVLNWFGDSLDGTLARVRNRQRPRFGYYVDHVIDMLGAAMVLGGLAMSGYMTPLIALALLAAFLLVASETYLAAHVLKTFRLSFLVFGPTELRIVLAIGTVYLLHKPWVKIGSLGPYLLFDVGGLVAVVGLLISLLVAAIRNTRMLYSAEKL
jgi:archaetidylinositol phosphate synthase